MKRTKQLRLLLLGGGIAAGANSACSPSAATPQEPRVSTDSYYTNDHYIAGVGYYHAPFRAFFPHRYNHYDAATRRYYFGGEWGAAPHQSAINISTPTAQAAASAENARIASTRGGFGGTGGSHFVRS